VVAGDMNINGRTSPTDGTPNRLFQRFVSDLQPLNQSGYYTYIRIHMYIHMHVYIYTYIYIRNI